MEKKEEIPSSNQVSRRNLLAVTGGVAAALTAACSPAVTAAPLTLQPQGQGGQQDEKLFRFDNSALVFIDYQPEMVAGVHSMDTKLMMLNARALARLAVKTGMPIVLSTVAVKIGINGPTVPELRNELGNITEIDRSTMNAWDDEPFRQALLRTGRRRFVMAGLWTEICLAFPIADMQAEGFKTTFPADAVGGTTKYAHDMAVDRMIQTGSVPNTTFATMAEWVLDWASPQGAMLGEVGAWYGAELRAL